MRRVLVLVLGCFPLAASGCIPPPPPVYADPVTVSKLASIQIPPSATNVMCRTDRDDTGGWLGPPQPDHRYWGRFDIPVADLQLALAGMPKDSKVERYSGYSHVTSHTPSEAWWHPEQLRNPQVAEWTVMGPKTAINLMFGEMGTDGMLTVYFFNFEM